MVSNFLVLTDKERYRRNCGCDNFFALLQALPQIKVIEMKYILGFFDTFDYWRLKSKPELLDAMELRADMGAIEVWSRIRVSSDEDKMFQRWHHGRWEVGKRRRLR
ncbi:hypothetical protein G6011_09420 [Alternaria panax]|uniref:Uncharacterized protein n=1 Tax=Alternaria panax TaxID=48097 RepID=A0AAD4NP83_9PLEO|nr:hypothetical protein G6011_09420 [Alternaria panax]